MVANRYDRPEILVALEAVRRHACCYSDGTKDARPCDCKFGVKIPFKEGYENTGCPEMRVIIAMVLSMTDEEWATFSQRVVDMKSWPKLLT